MINLFPLIYIGKNELNVHIALNLMKVHGEKVDYDSNTLLTSEASRKKLILKPFVKTAPKKIYRLLKDIGSEEKIIKSYNDLETLNNFYQCAFFFVSYSPIMKVFNISENEGWVEWHKIFKINASASSPETKARKIGKLPVRARLNYNFYESFLKKAIELRGKQFPSNTSRFERVFSNSFDKDIYNDIVNIHGGSRDIIHNNTSALPKQIELNGKEVDLNHIAFCSLPSRRYYSDSTKGYILLNGKTIENNEPTNREFMNWFFTSII